MAEVKIQITAQDRATGVISGIKNIFESLSNPIREITNSALTADNVITTLLNKLTRLKDLTSTRIEPQAGIWGALLVILGALGSAAGIYDVAAKQFDTTAKELNSAIAHLESSIDQFSQRLSGAIEQLKTSLDNLSNTLKQHPVLSGKMEREFKLNTAGAISALRELKSAIDRISSPIERLLKVNAYDALLSIGRVKSALDSIPDIIYKTVVIQYKTQASPVMPFSEGMEMVRKKMESLPAFTAHTVRFSASPLNLRGDRGGLPVSVHFGDIHINGSGDGGRIAADFQKKLADDIESGRSPVLPALKKTIRRPA
jgi:uncharacterized phage infection (PIP) family protein YhgE